MKRSLTRKILALVLALCVLAPQAAFAAGATTYIEVSITEDRGNRSVSDASSKYLTTASPLAAEVVQIINDNYAKMESTFASPAMKKVMDEGLQAFRNDTQWANYVDKYYTDVTNISSGNLKDILKDKTSTLGDLSVNTTYQITYKNEVVGDAKYGTTYTVTVIRRSNASESSSVLVAPEVSGTSKLLNSDDHIAFMSGYPDGSFQPNASVSRVEVAQIFYNLLRDQNVTITASFSDVAENAWYAKAVNTLASLGVISGVGGQKFEPDRAITRAEFTAIAAKFANAAGGSVNFNDVPTTHWAYQSIATAASYGWVSGVGDNQFAPDRSITRAEAATIVNHMLGRLGDQDKIDAGAGVSFSDVSQSHWAWYEIAEATTAHSYSLDSGRTVETWK